jgi:DNA-binding CsgD family transcriptional regulator
MLSTGQIALSPRELQVMQLLANGDTEEACAVRLGISRRTVQDYKRAVRDKLQVRSTTQAVAILVTAKIVQVG